MFKQNEKAIAQIADYIPRACRGMQLQEAKARLEKKIALYIDDGCDAAVLNEAFAPALNSHTRESFFVHRSATPPRRHPVSNRFYMMCLRETVGNNASFHCHNGNGYSSDIDRAHVYTLEEAQKAWNCGRDIDQPVCADSVDAMAVWHVDCQYIPTESLIESDCTAYVAYKKGSWNGNDVYWLQHGGLPTDDFSKATIFSVANKNEPGIVWLPFSIADAAKRRTFNINNFNRRTMVQGAGLVMPDWLKEQNRRKKSRSGRCVGIVRIAEK